MSRWLTKPGQYGTLYRYELTYRDEHDADCPEMRWRCWAYDAEHAAIKFLESEDADGWVIVGNPRRVPDRT